MHAHACVVLMYTAKSAPLRKHATTHPTPDTITLSNCVVLRLHYKHMVNYAFTLYSTWRAYARTRAHALTHTHTHTHTHAHAHTHTQSHTHTHTHLSCVDVHRKVGPVAHEVCVAHVVLGHAPSKNEHTCAHFRKRNTVWSSPLCLSEQLWAPNRAERGEMGAGGQWGTGGCSMMVGL